MSKKIKALEINKSLSPDERLACAVIRRAWLDLYCSEWEKMTNSKTECLMNLESANWFFEHFEETIWHSITGFKKKYLLELMDKFQEDEIEPR